MWNILNGDQIVLQLPKQFNMDSMYSFIQRAVNEQGDAQCKEITFDFSTLVFIEPVAIVVLSNLIEYFLKLGVKTNFSGHKNLTKPIIYLDDSGFFKHYLGKTLRVHAALRDTTLPLQLVANPKAIAYLYGEMMPWIALQLHTTEAAIATVRVCLQEIFHNINDHSGVNVGCVFAQHFPAKNEIHVAISDFGFGIPSNVRKVKPEVSDSQALSLALQEGFTTKSNVQNRGAGLPILMRYVTLRNRGAVLITSGKGNISAVLDGQTTKVTARDRPVAYPGTLVRVIFRTDTLENLAEDVEHEEFSW